MDTLLGILFIVLIVGLFKPKLVLRWDKNPTRLKVFLYWFFISMLLSFIIGNDEIEEKTITKETTVEETVETESQHKTNRDNNINIKSDKQFNLQEFENKYGIQMFDGELDRTTSKGKQAWDIFRERSPKEYENYIRDIKITNRTDNIWYTKLIGNYPKISNSVSDFIPDSKSYIQFGSF